MINTNTHINTPKQIEAGELNKYQVSANPKSLTALGIILGALGIGASAYGVHATNNANRRIAREAQEHEKEMWDMQNQYNDPKAQMQRLKTAGLNPNMVYGSGNVSGLQSGEPPKAHRAEMQNPLEPFGMSSPLDLLNQYAQWEQTKANIDNVQQAANVNKARAINLGLTGPLLKSRNELLQQSLSQKGEMFPYQLSFQQRKTSKALHDVAIAKHKRKLMSIDAKLASTLEPLGLRLGDGMWYRLLSKLGTDVFNFSKTKFPKLNFKF